MTICVVVVVTPCCCSNCCLLLLLLLVRTAAAAATVVSAATATKHKNRGTLRCIYASTKLSRRSRGRDEDCDSKKDRVREKHARTQLQSPLRLTTAAAVYNLRSSRIGFASPSCCPAVPVAAAAVDAAVAAAADPPGRLGGPRCCCCWRGPPRCCCYSSTVQPQHCH